MNEQKLKEILQDIVRDFYKFSPDLRRIMLNKIEGCFEEKL